MNDPKNTARKNALYSQTITNQRKSVIEVAQVVPERVPARLVSGGGDWTVFEEILEVGLVAFDPLEFGRIGFDLPSLEDLQALAHAVSRDVVLHFSDERRRSGIVQRDYVVCVHGGLHAA
jgi:hypothetical protein